MVSVIKIIILAPIAGICIVAGYIVYFISLPFKFLCPPVDRCFGCVLGGIMGVVCKIFGEFGMF